MIYTALQAVPLKLIYTGARLTEAEGVGRHTEKPTDSWYQAMIPESIQRSVTKVKYKAKIKDIIF